MARLVILQGGEGVPHVIGDGETVIGRLPDCGLQLPSNTVSRRHASVFKIDADYFLEDRGSGNGTFLNGKQIAGRVPLNDGDQIKVGPVLLRFEGGRPQTGPSSVASTAIISADAPYRSEFDDSEFDVDLESEGRESSTIMGSVSAIGGFSGLDVRPEAKLKAVLEISRNLAGTLNAKSMLPKILDSLFVIFPHADRGCILLKDEQSGKMIPRAMKHRRQGEDASVKLSRTILNKVLEEKAAVLSADAASDAQFQASESISNLSIRSMMCAPMIGLQGDPAGVIHIDTQNPINQFKEEDLDLLTAVAGQAAMSYESARLLDTYVQKQKQDGELEIARGVQRALLPETMPEAAGYEFYASYHAAQAVGGDYYDAFLLDNGKICLSFGDVAGKGVPGALIMSRMSSCVRNTMEFVADAGKAIGPINNHMCAKMVEGRFVTYLLAIIDVQKHELSLVNCGHMSPMILKVDGSIEEFNEESIGLPVGVIENYPYEVVTRAIAPGETFVFFTDGVDEAMNPKGDLYTLARMRDFIRKGSRSPKILGEALLEDVRRHAAGQPQNDDITIMTFGRIPA